MATGTSVLDAKMTSPGRIGVLIFGIALIGDLQGFQPASALPFLMVGVALLTALGFEFVNRFHDTSNAVTTVIYTQSLEPHVAVVWSDTWNFIGGLVSIGAVAFSIVSLLPVELFLQVGSNAEFSVVFALRIEAIIWNLGTCISECPHQARTHWPGRSSE